ncbi:MULTISPECIES: DUF1330 domain-containing protein [unclassified Mesorhizobium]|uniref:DUF1330 domain-containing protein n=1 Tax=unclassified Mesorhizobium TaxID=325217 RepID=UPI0011268071|nr:MULTISPECIES: DUF1330 domain-containing protein [unclassified Mesorhizobium]TPJ39896.1 DUF1330 domain-containing protein [Mesorhizobium sp. B2-6-6]MBZ9918461.1 DUF1330 domain-containing protein [Mesorhizobium sp. BR1-1-7]MBZ9972949.1 DUF1330 domain-containing protein [Mesorhizobium sp. BR1-1-12]MBZ9980001.1 DUF1330 domain-containing protein [Mesorhizobium sp. BR-1-1-8]MCA0003375.1 DUF1330 domain-containing protein [Mesorhizobium sp. B264B2A]
MSKKGYWMAMIDVRDPDLYKRYIEANAVAFAKYGAKFVVRAGRHESPEGPTGNRHVLVEFESYAKAVECYHSPEYQQASKFRLAASTGHFVIVEGA